MFSWQGMERPHKISSDGWSPQESIIWLSISTSRCILKKCDNVCSLKDMYTNVFNSIIHNSQKQQLENIVVRWKEYRGWELKEANLISTFWVIACYFFLNYSLLIYKMENKYYTGLLWWINNFLKIDLKWDGKCTQILLY